MGLKSLFLALWALSAAPSSAARAEEEQRFWSLRPLERVSPPEVKDASWCRTPVDRFVLARLEARGLRPNPPSGRRQLIRRASFDLLGLPPEPEEVEAFAGDSSPDAYRKLIDRLLSSPHYGERWARHWLDLARFAESHGFEHDYDRPSAYHYRDFVIQALNQDMAYDRFVRFQIAGDELEPENPLALMATGFLAAGVHSTQITANQVEKERYDEMDDMASTIGTAMLGLTLGCARCHDHKYDPIRQQDYYRFISSFTTTVRSEIDLDLDPERTREARAAFERELKPLLEARERFEREELPGRFAEWLRAVSPPPRPRWLVLEEVSCRSQAGATFTRLDDGSFLAAGPNPTSDTYTLVARTPLEVITAVRLEALSHPSLSKGGPGRAPNGNFALSDLRLEATGLPEEKEAAHPLKLVSPQATFEQKGLPVSAAIDRDPRSAWAVDAQIGKDHAAVFELERPQAHPGGSVLTFTLKFANNEGHQLGRLRLSVSGSPRPASLAGEVGRDRQVLAVERILAAPRERWSAEDRSLLLTWYKGLDPGWQALNDAVRERLKLAPRPDLKKVLISSEGLPAVRLHTQGADFFEKTYYLRRGDPTEKEGEASQGFLPILMRSPESEKRWQVAPPPGWRTSYRRRALAAWITDPDCGAGQLLARVMVNRLWEHHLGRGLVATPSDFGAQGERPTHPELLDWLAGELIREGFRLKPIHRLILESAVYMETCESDPAREALDPDWKLLWRRSRRRLEGEVIRDAMLAASGELDRGLFGPGTLDPAQHRRSIYFTVKRSQLIPMMALFDAPDGLQSLGLRSSTTVAPQALLLMNNPQVLGYAQGFARRVLAAAGSSPAEAVGAAYRIALARPPGAGEEADALAFLESQAETYRAAGRSQARELALADFCQTLLALNEFVYLE